MLLTAQQLETMSVEEIRQAVEQRLYYDEFQWLETRPAVRYGGKNLAQGLENILSVCPVCGGRHTVTTRKREVFCENCGKLTSMDSRYRFDADFRFSDFSQWFDWQKTVMEAEILGNPEFSMSSPVELRLPGNGKSLTRHGGEGICTLDRSGLTYTGKLMHRIFYNS